MMQQTFSIKKLELIDFMKFNHKVFNFADDLAIVIGGNGTGKSSILEALALSFQVKDRGSSVQRYIRHGKTSATVKLTCNWLGKDLVIESTFATAGARRIHRVVTYDGNTYEDTRANNYLLEFFDNRSLVVAFALQGNEKFLTTSRTTNLKNLINLLQLDFSKELVYTKGQVNTFEKEKTEVLNEINRQQGAYEVLINNKEQTDSRLVELKKQLELVENGVPVDINNLDAQLFELKNNLQEILKAKQSSDNLLLNLNAAKSQLQTNKNNLQNVDNQLSNLPVDADIQDTKETEDLISKLNQEILDLQNTISQIGQASTEVNNNLTVLRTKQSFELKRKQQLADGICPTCLQKVEKATSLELDQKIQQIATDMENLEKTLQEKGQAKLDAEKQLSEVKQQGAAADKQLNEIQKKNAEIEHSKALKETLLGSKKSLEQLISASQTTVDDLQKQYSESVVDRSQEISEYQNKINEIESQKTNALNLSQQKISVKNGISECEQLLNRLKNDIEITKQNIDAKTASLETIQKDIEKWTKAQETFTLLPKIHLKTFIDDIKVVCSSIAAEFGYKGIDILSDEKGIDFILQDWPLEDVTEANTEYEMCSAFERNLINLSLVYALSRMFRVPFVCIDELDSSADIENTAKLGELVKLILQYTPVVTVSHDSSLVDSLLQSNYKVSILKTEEEKE